MCWMTSRLTLDYVSSYPLLKLYFHPSIYLALSLTHTHSPPPLFSFSPSLYLSYTKQKGHSCQDPLGRPLPGLETEGPDVGVAAELGLVDGALIGVARLLAVVGHRPHKDHRHAGSQVLQARLRDVPALDVPACTWVVGRYQRGSCEGQRERS